jgi:tetrahydromethanopterin S-methyltransferase subunit A
MSGFMEGLMHILAIPAVRFILVAGVAVAGYIAIRDMVRESRRGREEKEKAVGVRGRR